GAAFAGGLVAAARAHGRAGTAWVAAGRVAVGPRETAVGSAVPAVTVGTRTLGRAVPALVGVTLALCSPGQTRLEPTTRPRGRTRSEVDHQLGNPKRLR